MSKDKLVTYETKDHVATITLSRPAVRNALNRQAYRELEECFRRAQSETDVRCVVLTGQDPAFCSGDDVKEIMLAEQDRPTLDRLRPRPRATPAALAILDCDKPILAAVNGAAVGWGMDLSLFCDIRIASRNAVFGEIFIKRGLISDLGGLWRLPQVVGPSKAAELLFTGEVIDAEEAERIGLVSRVVAHEDLLPTARELTAKIVANAPIALRFMKEGLRRSTFGDPREIGGWISGALGVLFETEDHKEGARSFVERREPVFTGR